MNYQITHTQRSARRLTRTILSAALLLTLGTTLSANAGPAPLPPNSHAYDQTLAQWQATWLAWAVGDLTPPTDTYGNALVTNVVLMAIPAAPGDGTPASINITLLSGEAFVVPLLVLVGNSSTPMVSATDFKNMTLTLTLDGDAILDGAGAFRYYTQTTFTPPLAGGTAWVQGISIVHTPLPVGNHVLKLDETITVPERGQTLVFHNTLNITVRPSD